MSAPVDIRPQDLAIVHNVVKAALPSDAKIYVFGSRATWTTKDSSDLDLAIDAGRRLTPQETTALAEAFDDSSLPYRVDVVDMHIVSAGFKAIIDRDKVRLPWKGSTWGEEITLNYGKAIRGYADKSDGYRVYGTNGPVGWHPEALAQGPGIILGRKGAYRGIHFSKDPFYVIDTAYYVVPKSNLDMRWLYYAMKYHRLGEIDDGSPIPSTTRAAVYVKDFDVPDITEQRAIATILSALDDKIEMNRRMNETLEGMAQAIFKDWFVDFGPVRRKLAGATDPAAIMGGLAPELAALFPYGFGDSGLPEGWRVSTLGNHMTNFDSKRVPVSGGERAKRKGTYPYHGATGVMDYIDNYLFDGIYLLVGEDGSVVKENGLGFTQYVWGQIWVNNHAHVLQGKGNVSTEQLLLYFQHVPVEPFITGAVQLKLSQGRMNAMPFVDAGDDISKQFYEIIKPLYARLRAGIDENRTLAETRDYLLPKLMSGQVRVRDAGKMVEDAA